MPFAGRLHVLQCYQSKRERYKATFKNVRENKILPAVAHKNIDSKIIGGSTLHNLYISYVFLFSNLSSSIYRNLNFVLITRKNPQADRNSQAADYFIYSTQWIYLSWGLSTYENERFLIFFCCFPLRSYFSSFWCLQTTCWTQDSLLFFSCFPFSSRRRHWKTQSI